MRKVAMLALAMLRSEQAWTHLLEQISAGRSALARDAIAALAVYRELPGLGDGDLGAEIRAAVARRGDGGEGLEHVLAEALER